MSHSLSQSERLDHLKRVDRPSPAKATLLNGVETSGQLLRLAIMRAGLSQKEAQDALGVDDKGQFSRMLDGKEGLSVHRLLRPGAELIWKELIFLTAAAIPGMSVERIVRLVESA
jgi:hypothetical protein